MQDLSDLKNRLHIQSLKLVTQTDSASVYQGHSSQGEIFIKITNSQTAHDCYCEILEALNKFPLTPKIYKRFEWEDSSVIVMSAIAGTSADQVLKDCSRPQKVTLLTTIGKALAELHQAIPNPCLLQMTYWRNRDGLVAQRLLWKQELELMVSKWMSRINPLAPDYYAFNVELDTLLK